MQYSLSMQLWTGLVVLWILTFQARAFACSAKFCDAAELGPPTAQSLPANTPAFFVRLDAIYSRNEQDAMAAPESQVRLLDADGRLVAVSLTSADPQNGYWVVPTRPLPAGTFKLGVLSSCARSRGQPESGAFSTPTWKEVPITIGSSTAFPTVAGRVSVLPAQQDDQYISGFYSYCEVWPHPSMVVKFNLEVDPSLVPFSSVTRWKLKVDGKLWARSRVGSLDAVRSIYEAERSVTEVHTLCEGPRSLYPPDPGLTAGAHTAEWIAEVGGVTLPPLSTTFSIACPKAPSIECQYTSGDAASTVALPCGTDDAGMDSPDAGIANADAVTSNADKHSAGCGYGGNARAPGPLFVALMALAWRLRHARGRDRYASEG